MPKKGTRRKWFLRGLLCGVVLLLALFFGGIAYMRYEAERLIVNRLEVRSDEWTLPPLKVAVAADFHVARDPDDMARLRRIVERTNAEKPDLILLPGDFAAGSGPVSPPSRRRLRTSLRSSRLRSVCTPCSATTITGRGRRTSSALLKRPGFRCWRTGRSNSNSGAGVFCWPALSMAGRRKSRTGMCCCRRTGCRASS